MDPQRMRRRTFLTAASTASSLALAGCSGDREAASEERETPVVYTPDAEAAAEDVEPADIRLVELRPGDVEVAYGESLDFEVVVENVGGVRDAYEIREMVGDEVQDSHRSLLAPGRSETFSGTLDSRFLEADDHYYGYATRDDYVAGVVTVSLEEFDPIMLSGWGREETDGFELAEGMVVSAWRHRDDRGFFRRRNWGDSGPESNFTANLIRADGDQPEAVVADGAGDVDGVWGQGLPAGEYHLDVDAAGSWAFEILQPRITIHGGEELPFSTSGEAAGDWFPVRTDGATTVAAEHEGSGPFTVESYRIDGTTHEDTELFDVEGEFSGERTYTHEWANFVVVQADGPWSLEFEHR